MNFIGWRDLIGDVSAKSTGLTSPILHNLNGAYRGWFYSNGNRADISYHIPHDYALGTDLYIHVHWTYNGTSIEGPLKVSHHLSYAKGHSQAKFTDEITVNQVIETAETEPLMHRIDEILVSSNDGRLLDTNLIEPDGIIFNSFIMDSVPTIVSKDLSLPMIICVDIHYQSTDKSTPQKSPDFYRVDGSDNVPSMH